MSDAMSVMATMTLVDKITGPLKNITAGMDTAGIKADSLSGKMIGIAKTMAPVAIASGVVVAGLASCVNESLKTEKALGELASVGVKDMGALKSAAISFSNEWAGTTTPDFISAAYDIKSGISSLSDYNIGEFTKIAAMTGKATKSTTAEMTSLFATGYGIYKGMYSNMSDLQFGEMFSGGIAASVQAFKTNGSEMASAIESLGSSATISKIPLQEQLAVLGLLQKTMGSGSEAGNAYKSVMESTGKASEKLGISFLDSNNNMLSMTGIIGKLKNKFGELDGIELNQIDDAFGGTAGAVIKNLYNKTDLLTLGIKDVSAAMGLGSEFTKKMADTMNKGLGAQLQLLGQQFNNLQTIIGGVFSPILEPLAVGVSKVVVFLQKMAESPVGRTIMIVAGSVAVAALAFTGFAVGIIAVKAGFLMMSGAIVPLVTGVWSFTVALLTCPLTWVVVGIVALCAGLYALYNKFQIVKDIVNTFMYTLGYLVGAYYAVSKAIVNAFMHPMETFKKLDGIVMGVLNGVLEKINGFVSLFVDVGKSIWNAIGDGIKSVISSPIKAVKSGIDSMISKIPFFGDNKSKALKATVDVQKNVSENVTSPTETTAGKIKNVVKKTALTGAIFSAITQPVAANPAVIPQGLNNNAQINSTMKPGALTNEQLSSIYKPGSFLENEKLNNKITEPVFREIEKNTTVSKEKTFESRTERTNEKSGIVINGGLTIYMDNVNDPVSFSDELQRFIELHGTEVNNAG